MEKRTCNKCSESKVLKDFEGGRKKCRKCYNEDRRVQSKKRPLQDRTQATHPTECSQPDCEQEWDPTCFKWKTDNGGRWSSICIACYNKKKYYEKHREVRSSLDRDGYLAHNAEIHHLWVERNRAHVQEYEKKRRTLLNPRWGQLVTAAKQRGIIVNYIEAEQIKKKMLDDCFYCGWHPLDEEPLNGIDRVDSMIGYTDANTVGACAICNFMKREWSVTFFLNAISKIALHACKKMEFLRTKGLPRSFGGHAELDGSKKARQSRKDVKVSAEVMAKLKTRACYLCGTCPSNGVDRVDSERCYESENVQPCCGVCNYLKKDLVLASFLSHVERITNAQMEK